MKHSPILAARLDARTRNSEGSAHVSHDPRHAPANGAPRGDVSETELRAHQAREAAPVPVMGTVDAQAPCGSPLAGDALLANYAHRIVNGDPAAFVSTMSRRERAELTDAAQALLDGCPEALAELVADQQAQERYAEFTDRLTERESELWGNEFPQWSERQPMVLMQGVR